MASDAPRTPHHTPLGVSFVLVVSVTAGKHHHGVTALLCWPRTRRAPGVTPLTAMGASSPQTHWAKCPRRPPELPAGPASLLLAVLRRLCAAEPRLCRVPLAPCHGRALTGGAQALPFLLPPLPRVPVPFSVIVFFCPLFLSPSFLSPPSLCPCPALCAGAGSLSFAPLTARTSQLSPQCWPCQPSPGPWSPLPGRGWEGSQSLGGDTEGARWAGGGCELGRL